MSDLMGIFNDFLKETSRAFEEIEIQAVCLSRELKNIDKKKEYPTFTLEKNKKELTAPQVEPNRNDVIAFIQTLLIKIQQIDSIRLIKMVKERFPSLTDLQIKMYIKELIDIGIIEH